MNLRRLLETLSIGMGLVCTSIMLMALYYISQGYDLFFFESNSVILYTEIGLCAVAIVGLLSLTHRKIRDYAPPYSGGVEWEAVLCEK